MALRVEIMVMSGVDDGKLLTFSSYNGDGSANEGAWLLRIGRRDGNDLILRNDTFASRDHAVLRLDLEGHWWLTDNNSRNGTFLDAGVDEARVSGAIPVSAGQLFRVGHTWLRIQEDSE
ncbi:MAG TPA: FHA domain-containing protein [Candidatus Limnocylindrales bacterium]|nr:FHA domain-containing protein [Candidatus Limnocylindrales bacterium]